MSKEVKEYIINTLSERREEFNGKAVCPFAAPELAANKLMFGVIGQKSLEELIEDFQKSDYESAIFIVKEEVTSEETKKFQIFVNRILKQKGMKGYKNICFNPNDRISINNYNPRSLAPYFLINIAESKVLSKGHKALMKTDYYDNMSDDYLDFLKIKKKA